MNSVTHLTQRIGSLTLVDELPLDDEHNDRGYWGYFDKRIRIRGNYMFTKGFPSKFSGTLNMLAHSTTDVDF